MATVPQTIGIGAQALLGMLAKIPSQVGGEAQALPSQAGGLLKQLILGPGSVAQNATSQAHAEGTAGAQPADPIPNSLYPQPTPQPAQIPAYNSFDIGPQEGLGSGWNLPYLGYSDVFNSPTLASLAPADRAYLAHRLYDKKYIDPQVQYFIAHGIVTGQTNNNWVNQSTIDQLKSIDAGKSKIPVGDLGTDLLYSLEKNSDVNNPLHSLYLDTIAKPRYQDRYNKLGY